MFKKLLLITILVATAQFTQAQKEDPKSPNWEKYHTTADAYYLLQEWAKAYPNLTKLYSIGETLKGTQLMVLEITNKSTGASEDKPAYYYDGNIHAGELTGAEVALHYTWLLLSSYGKDPRITNLVDSRTIYIRPKFNPDGADIALTTPQALRSTPRPYDQDGDGLLDEDPGNDLNKDNLITEMRVKNPTGKWKISLEDPRIMVEREPNDLSGDFYDIYDEGIDDDNDGLYNEDGVGGIDMNRNFPRNWGLESEQRGAGPYPLSEPETRATIEFLTSHRNITGIFHGHTAAGFLYRLPSTTNWDNFNMEDQRLILELSDKYATTTSQKVVPSYSNPRLHRHGTLISWGYWDYGVVGFVPEFWGAFQADANKDGRVTDLERMQWNDAELGGKGFVNWQAYDHPQLGKVEIGGWDYKFTRQNPPTKYLKGEIEKYVEWMLWLAETSPKIAVSQPKVEVLEKGKLVKVSLTVENDGYLPTNITERAIELEIAKPVRAIVELSGAELISGKMRTDLGNLAGRRDGESAERAKTVEYLFKVTSSAPKVTITIDSEKGGKVRREVGLR
ncbi:MAG: M14 family metallopeptidase [Imperialibacter sp.]|uniref:M14 family metallopeptidase n=1 Tax=Imperialibacter sp. TaxID=2038411 RepID=UPI0032EBB240